MIADSYRTTLIDRFMLQHLDHGLIIVYHITRIHIHTHDTRHTPSFPSSILHNLHISLPLLGNLDHLINALLIPIQNPHRLILHTLI